MDDATLKAFEAVFAALKPLDEVSRARVLSSIHAMLGIEPPATADKAAAAKIEVVAPRGESTRPLSLIELLKVHPGPTIHQLITLFAYYRDKHEAIPRFSRADLKDYFARAHQSPPGNYDRDFTKAVKNGWIHEDNDDSYITSRGIEAVEAGFPGERKMSRGSKPAVRKSARAKRSAKKIAAKKPGKKAAKKPRK